MASRNTHRMAQISFAPNGPGEPNETTGKNCAKDDTIMMEKQYLLSCERGDMGSVRHFIRLAHDNPQFNLNCVDPLGRTALLIAIENENIEMIEILLDVNVETGDAILYAINEENVEAVEIILDHMEKKDKSMTDSQAEDRDINQNSAFAPDITPIILAAHRDNYEIIRLLLDRGASIAHPHDVRCACKDCIKANLDDSLRLSRSRINAYRALASPSLICLSSRDPILLAFELSWELRRLSYIENEFRTDYQELSQKLQQFSTAMLDQVRGSKELEIVLNHDNSDRMTAAVKDSRGADRMQLARLKLAIQYRQKRFVAHPNCQQLLASIWYEGLLGFRRRHASLKALLIMGIIVCFPILSLLYLIFPKAKFTRFIRKPFIKFLCHSASYGVFLLLLILASQRINYDELFSPAKTPEQLAASSNTSTDGTDPDRKERRGPPPTPVEWAIMAWVAGLIWVEVKQLWDEGMHEYAHNMWNILDFITNALYICTFALRCIAYLQVERELATPSEAHIARKLARRNWDPWDPTLISECLFATANIFSSLKLVHIFTVNPHLGPLQISLGRMVVDILKFFAVYVLVLFAFGCGLNQLFWYYAAMRAQECTWSKSTGLLDDKVRESLADSCAKRYSSFANPYKAFESLFWSSLGLLGLEATDIDEGHYVTAWAGKCMLGGYNIIACIVLTNMLIAMMTESYSRIHNQADAEWKFARSKLWIEYFEEGGTLPPPFNIIVSPKSIYYVLKWFCERFCKQCTRRMQPTKHRSVKLQKILKAVSQREANYQLVMRNLVKRYVAQEQRRKQLAEGVSEDDVNEIKQDISSFRFELLGILRNAGYNTGHADMSQKRLNKRGRTAERRIFKGFNMDNQPIPEAGAYLTKEDEERTRSMDKADHAESRSPWSTIKRMSRSVKFSPATTTNANGKNVPTIPTVHFAFADKLKDSAQTDRRKPIIKQKSLGRDFSIDLERIDESDRVPSRSPEPPPLDQGELSASMHDTML